MDRLAVKYEEAHGREEKRIPGGFRSQGREEEENLSLST